MIFCELFEFTIFLIGAETLKIFLYIISENIFHTLPRTALLTIALTKLTVYVYIAINIKKK